MSEIRSITQQLIEFRDLRDWEQFHDSKNLALALSIEASELNELYLWKNSPEDIQSVDKERLSDELADVLAYAFLLAEKNSLNIHDIISNKIQKNKEKYPVEKSKGSSTKYNQL